MYVCVCVCVLVHELLDQESAEVPSNRIILGKVRCGGSSSTSVQEFSHETYTHMPCNTTHVAGGCTPDSMESERIGLLATHTLQ